MSGLDSSAVVAFIRTHRLAAAQGFTLLLTGVSAQVRGQLERGGLSEATLDQVRLFPELDRAIEWCEDRLLERKQASRVGPRPLETVLRDGLGLTIEAKRLLPYLEAIDVPGGHEVIRQGEPSTDVFLLESGLLTAVLTRSDGDQFRLRTMAPGAIVGEVTLYLGTVRTASVITEQPSRLYRLTAQALERMEREEPEIAGALHRAFARLLAQRLTDSLRTLDALLD